MSKSWNRMETWGALAVLAVGGVLAAIAGLHVYTTATAVRWHPEPNRVPSVSQTVISPRWTDAVERSRQAVRAALSEQNLPGVSVAVGLDDDLVWAEGFGWSDVERRVGVTPATRFRIGTASVVLTSAAAGLLLDEGRLKLDEPVQTYVPAYPGKRWPVTLRQLLGHTAGLRNGGGDEAPLHGKHCGRPLDALEVFGDDDLRFEPGTRYAYSNYGWILVGAAIESAAQASIGAFMQARLFEPLGMSSTALDGSIGADPDVTRTYFPRYAADPRYGLHDLPDVDLSCFGGAAAFVSTPTDLVRFGLAVQAGSVLRPDTVTLMQTPQRLATGAETGYGLGWDLETVTLAGTPTVVAGHDGDLLGGQVASLLTVPGRRVVVVVTSNIAYAKTQAIAAAVAAAFVR